MNQNLGFVHIKNFISKKDSLKIKKDLEKIIKSNVFMDNKITGKQSLNNLHKIFKTKHWKNYYKQLSEITKKYNF